MTAVLRAPPSARDRGLHFGCGSCGATLSVPKRLAGVSGACPLCGEWLESPRPPPSPVEKPGPGEFVASRIIIADSTLATSEAGSRTRSEKDWRVWRERRARFKKWFRRRQALLSVSALIVVGAAVVFFSSLGWKLPWQLPEDSFLVRLLEEMGGESTTDRSGGSVPDGPRRR